MRIGRSTYPSGDGPRSGSGSAEPLGTAVLPRRDGERRALAGRGSRAADVDEILDGISDLYAITADDRARRAA